MEASTATPGTLPAAQPAVLQLHEALGVRPVDTARRPDERGYILRRLLVVADLLSLSLAFGLVELIGGLSGSEGYPIHTDLLLLALGGPIWLLLAYAYGLYHVDSKRADYGVAEELGPIVQMATIWSWAVLLGTSLSGLRPVAVDDIALFWIVTIVLLTFVRAAVRAWSRRRVWYLQNALVVGTGSSAAGVVRKLLRHPEYGINVIACVNLSPLVPSPQRVRYLQHVPLIQGEVDVRELVDALEVDRVLVVDSHLPVERRSALVRELADQGVHVDLVPGWSDVIGGRLDVSELEGMALLSVPQARMSRSSRCIKRVLDIVLGGLTLLALSPFMLLAALAIKLDSDGPVFFRQRRVGRNGKHFEVFKFRTMCVDADDIKHKVAELNYHGGGNDSGMFKIREDPRITRVGAFLRRSSLDELPQLLNVMWGHMSLVGPRPLIENEDRQVEGRFRQRVSITPGLTGLWQVHGRAEIPFEEMVKLDYLYVTNWSLSLDLKVLLKTFTAVFKGSGAY
jgi:exopolysaccharide biosynthesis polyprenyl glycosylphosphotransferase